MFCHSSLEILSRSFRWGPFLGLSRDACLGVGQAGQDRDSHRFVPRAFLICLRVLLDNEPSVHSEFLGTLDQVLIKYFALSSFSQNRCPVF